MADYGVLGALAGAQQGLVTGLNIAAARRGEERQQRYLDIQEQAVQAQGQQEASRLYLAKQAEASGIQAQLDPLIEKRERGEKLSDEEYKQFMVLSPQAENAKAVLDDAEMFFESQGWSLPAGGLPFKTSRAPASRVNLGRAIGSRSFMVNPKTGARVR